MVVVLDMVVVVVMVVVLVEVIDVKNKLCIRSHFYIVQYSA
jgi:hypothetical protein